MKKTRIILAGLAGLVSAVLMTSCGDEEGWTWQGAGSKVEMSRDRAFVNNEGSFGKNNAHLGCFSFFSDKIFSGDVYEAQNLRKIGDISQDLIAYNGNLYMVVSGSSYLAMLDGVGKELRRFSFAEHSNLGQPRYLAASGKYVYVTSYGGFVNRFDAATLELVASVQVGANPEQIVVTGGKIYCVNSGWGMGNTMSVIDEQKFDNAESVVVMQNPQRLTVAGGKLFIQGTGADSSTPAVDMYDPQTGKSVNIGKGMSMDSFGNMVYVADVTVDYTIQPYGGNTRLYSYNVATGEKNENAFKNIPTELADACAYGVSVNPYTGHIYVCTTKYVWGDGQVYHFDNNGTYIGMLPSGGQYPCKVVFIY